MANRQDYPIGLYDSKSRPKYVQNIDAISQEDINFFHSHGYLAIRELFDCKTISKAKSEIQRLISGEVKEFNGIQYEQSNPAKEQLKSVRKLMGFVDHSTHLSKMAKETDLINLVGRLIDDSNPLLFQDMALLKGPHGREKPWHQDAAYFDLSINVTIIGVWIALDTATKANGCLHVLPKTHKSGPADHFHIRDWQLCDTSIQTALDVAIPLDPGGCLLWHGLLHHGSPKNDTGATRAALQFHYKPNSCENITTEERMQHFGGDVRGATC